MPKAAQRETEVKIVGKGGQISLGKEFAGRYVVIQKVGQGSWKIDTAQVIPDNEHYLHEEPMKSQLDEALEWLDTTPRQETNLDTLESSLLKHHGKR